MGIPEPFRPLSSIRHGWTYANTVLVMPGPCAGSSPPARSLRRCRPPRRQTPVRLQGGSPTACTGRNGGNGRPPDDAGPRDRQDRRVHQLFHADWEVRSAEIGYGVRADERDKGYASEALGAIARWALAEGGVQRAWLPANTDNVASVRVAEKAGFRQEGTLRRYWLEDDGLHDLAVFSLLDDEL